MENLINVSLDRLVLIYKNVTLLEYDKFVSRLTAHQYLYPKTIINPGMSSAISAYRYNLKFGYGEGSIRVDYKHNTLDEDIQECDMRIEFNPSKLHKMNYEYEMKNNKVPDYRIESSVPEVVTMFAEPSKVFFKELNTIFSRGMNDKRMLKKLTEKEYGHIRMIRELDIAFDFDLPMDRFIVKSLTGKAHSHYKGTHYWGNKHTHGYMKMYDKKKERIKARDEDFEHEKYESLTRLEYTMRFDNCRISDIARIKDFELRNDYIASIYDVDEFEKMDKTTKAYLLCYMNGLMEFNEMSRRYQEKTKKALQELRTVDFDSILSKTFKEKIIKIILNYIRL